MATNNKATANKTTKAVPTTKKAIAKAPAKAVAPTQLMCVKNATGKFVYPQGQSNITLLPQPKGLGSNQLTHYAALQAAFGTNKTMALPALVAALGAAKLGRRTVRRAGRAQCYSFTA